MIGYGSGARICPLTSAPCVGLRSGSTAVRGLRHDAVAILGPHAVRRVSLGGKACLGFEGAHRDSGVGGSELDRVRQQVERKQQDSKHFRKMAQEFKLALIHMANEIGYCRRLKQYLLREIE